MSSVEIFWIAPIVDVILFSVLILVLGGAGRIIQKVGTQTVVTLLAALTVYDWLTVTGRLSHLACLLLATGAGIALSRWVANHEIATLRFVRRTVALMAALVVLAVVGIKGNRWLRETRAVASLPPAAVDAPNILVIVVDTLRADHLSSFGYARPTSPNIDRLAAQGVLFEKRHLHFVLDFSFTCFVADRSLSVRARHGQRSDKCRCWVRRRSVPTVCPRWERP